MEKIFNEIINIDQKKEEFYLIFSSGLADAIIKDLIVKLESVGKQVKIACLWIEKELIQGDYIYPCIRKYVEPFKNSSQVIILGLEGLSDSIVAEVEINASAYIIQGLKEESFKGTPELIKERREIYLKTDS